MTTPPPAVTAEQAQAWPVGKDGQRAIALEATHYRVLSLRAQCWKTALALEKAECGGEHRYQLRSKMNRLASALADAERQEAALPPVPGKVE